MSSSSPPTQQQQGLNKKRKDGGVSNNPSMPPPPVQHQQGQNKKKKDGGTPNPSITTGTANSAAPVFLIAAAAKRELRRTLLRSKDPVNTIHTFQQTHSLHSMMARAFGTVPQSIGEQSYDNNSSINNTPAREESLDSTSVMAFLSHLGLSHYEVHKRITDVLLTNLQDEIRKTQNERPLLELLKSSWGYATTTIPELRPVLWMVLKQLGQRTPLTVLKALTERDAQGQQLKYADIFKPLPPLLKRLCWEADWDEHIPLDLDPDQVQSSQYMELIQSTLFYQTIQPILNEYTCNATLVEAADHPFVATLRERRMLTTQRRALTTLLSSTVVSSSLAAAAGVVSPATVDGSGAVVIGISSTSAGNILKAAVGVTAGPTTATSSKSQLSTSTTTTTNSMKSGKAVAQLRNLLCDTSATTTSSYRPKLLYALLSILMTQHSSAGSGITAPFSSSMDSAGDAAVLLGGGHYLTCTLTSDILLSAGGPLPKAYSELQELARVLDECVQEGNVSDQRLIKVQSLLRLIFHPDQGTKSEEGHKDEQEREEHIRRGAHTDDDIKAGGDLKGLDTPTNSVKRQLNRIITAGIKAMKDADPQHLFLNPVTDAIAPGYSKIISKPICILSMEQKVEKGIYTNMNEWEDDVKLMFKNCVEYNQGKSGAWFRGEALRQGKVFREEIFPQARRLYQSELAKRSVATTTEDVVGQKRKADSVVRSEIKPLVASTKKRRTDNKDEYIPSIPALASMLLSDPFVVRILLARLLRDLRVGVLGGSSIPVAHTAVPSLLQILHIARCSTMLCASRGNCYFVPDAGLGTTVQKDPSTQDPGSEIPYISLRRYIPMFLNLVMEAELDRRAAPGGDLFDAFQTSSLQREQPSRDLWQSEHSSQLNVVVSLIEGGLVQLCQPDNKNEASLAITYPKFAMAIEVASATLWLDRPFFTCLIKTLLKHKSKLPKPTRDAVVQSWLSWLRRDCQEMGSMTSACHESLIQLFNEWSALGNLLLPRDALVQFATEAVRAADYSEKRAERKFLRLWAATNPLVEFDSVRGQYQRMLRHLPHSHATQWKENVGIQHVEQSEAIAMSELTN